MDDSTRPVNTQDLDSWEVSRNYTAGVSIILTGGSYTGWESPRFTLKPSHEADGSTSNERINRLDPLRARWPDFDVCVLPLGVGLGLGTRSTTGGPDSQDPLTNDMPHDLNVSNLRSAKPEQ